MAKSIKKSWRKKLLLVVIGIFAGVLMTEILLRVIGYSYPDFYIADYDRGIALRPGAAGLYQREGQNYVTINSEGLRDREHSKSKPPNTIRIALLGDSYCEALQVPIEQTFWWQLQQKLDGCQALAGKHVEVINFGVSGYGTAQELITLQQKVWQYSPDIVMLMVTTNNDVSDNVRELKKTDQIPYFVYRDGQLVRDDSFRNSKGFGWRTSRLGRISSWFRESLRIVQLIDYVQFFAKYKWNEWQSQSKSSTVPSEPTKQVAREVSVENMIYLEPREDLWKQAWQVTESLLTEMGREVNAKGARFFLVVGSNPIQVLPDSSARSNFAAGIGAPNLFYGNDRLAKFAAGEQIDFLDLTQPLQAYADQNKVFLHGFGKQIGNGHWNAAGHQVAADLISNRLCATLAEPRRLISQLQNRSTASRCETSLSPIDP